MGRKVTRPSDIQARQREADALRLRLAGLTLEQIAAQVGLQTPTGAWHAITRALERAVPPEDVDQLRATEAARLDRLLAARWQAALQGDDKAVDQCLRIIDQRRRLYGLDRPAKIDATVEHRTVAPIDEELARLAEQLGADPERVDD